MDAFSPAWKSHSISAVATQAWKSSIKTVYGILNYSLLATFQLCLEVTFMASKQANAQPPRPPAADLRLACMLHRRTCPTCGPGARPLQRHTCSAGWAAASASAQSQRRQLRISSSASFTSAAQKAHAAMQGLPSFTCVRASPHGARCPSHHCGRHRAAAAGAGRCQELRRMAAMARR